jgi:PPOX class probable F420-dependent enzyme
MSTSKDDLLAATNHGALVTLKRDGRPQLSNVGHTYDPATGVIRISVTDGRAMTANLRRDPRASYYVTTPDMGGYLIAEGTAELTPVTTAPDDATADELVEVYRAIAGEHPDWAEFRAAMVEDHRLVIRIPVDRTYGWARSTA